MKNPFMKIPNGALIAVATAVAALIVQTASADWIPIYSYTYTSGTLAGAGGAFETANNSILRDGYYTTQADVTAAAGNPRAYYVNGSSSQRGFIAGGGGGGASPQPGITFDLGQVQPLTNVTIFYADLYADGVSAPSRVVISVDGGPTFTNSNFNTSRNVSQYGDARALSIDLTGQTGRYVQMDFYNPGAYGAPGGEWTAINEIMFFGPATNALPVIVQQPSPGDLQLFESQRANFQVLALGTRPLSYQWRTNGSPIAAATGTNYTIGSVHLSNAASYDVVVMNSFGSVTSAVVNLTVSPGLPVITNNPVGFTLEQGYSRVLSGVAAAGLLPFGYQWTKDGTPIAGATNSFYAVLHAQSTANYRVILTNNFGSATSEVATVTVDAANTIATASYAYTSGSLAGAGGAFETTNHSILSDGFATTQADVDAAASNPWGYYVNGNSPQLGFITGRPGLAGPYGVYPQPGILFDLGAPQKLTQVKIFYVDRYGHGVSAPSSVVISVDGGTPFTNSGFDTSQNIYNYGDARVLAIDLTGYAGRYVQMDFYNPVTAGAPGGEWTSLNEVMFYGSTATNVPPVIVQNPTPTNLVLQAGQSATFQALASGTAPLSYLWRKGTTPITGATGASYTIPTALTSDTGSYAVVVTNNFGSVTSAVANLTVILGQPFITNQPVGFTLEQGYSRVLSGVAAAGAQPISYQWTRDGTPINGATNSTYAVLHALSTANYRVILTNSVGSATSAVATVTVIPTNTITGISYTYSSGTLAGYPFETTNHSILSDGYATIQADVDAAAGHPPGYYVNGTAPFPQWGFLTGPGSAPVGTIPQPGIRFDLGVAQELTQVKVFYVDKYTDGVSAPSSVVISIDAGNPFTNTGFDTSQSVDPYGDARALTIDLTGHTGRYVQMDFYNPENNGYPGGQWTALSETMFYGNVATNWNVSPVIVQDTTPTSLEIYASQSATFRAVVSGTEPLHYQWWKNGVTPVPGATAASYTIMNAQVGDSGSYALVVTNTFGSVTSAVATLTVTLGLPFFTNEPVGFSLEQGYSRVMSGVGVGGLQPITYQWTQDGTPIAGATNASYAVLHAQNTANYRVILTNSFGSATSDVATVTVIATNTITGVSYAYTSGTLAGAGGTFETTNHSILSDGFATTQDDVDAAAGNPWGYYVNGNSPQLGFIIGPGSAPVGTIPQPGIRFDLGAAQNLTQVTIFYVDRYGHGVSAPSSVVISVDAGTPFTKTGFDTSQNVDTYGDARALTIDLTGYTGRYVQMDVYNPENYGYPGGQWTALSEVMFYGSTAGNELSFTTSGGQLTLSWTGTGYHAQANPVVNNAGGWTNVPGGNLSPLIVPIAPTGNLFYRLIKP